MKITIKYMAPETERAIDWINGNFPMLAYFKHKKETTVVLIAKTVGISSSEFVGIVLKDTTGEEEVGKSFKITKLDYDDHMLYRYIGNEVTATLVS